MADGFRARMLDCWSIKPLDTEAVVQAAQETSLVITVEEQSIYGGLGSAIANILAQRCPVPMRLLGFPDEWLPAGSSVDLFRHYGLTAEGIASTVRAALDLKVGGKKIFMRSRSVSILAIDQSTSATKGILFDQEKRLLDRIAVQHQQYYPQPGSRRARRITDSRERQAGHQRPTK